METVKDCSKNVLRTLTDLKLTAIVLLCFCDVTCVGSDGHELSQTNVFHMQNILSLLKATLGIQNEVTEEPELEESPDGETQLDQSDDKGAKGHSSEIGLGLRTEGADAKPGNNSAVHEEPRKSIPDEGKQEQGMNFGADAEDEDTRGEGREIIEEFFETVTAEFDEQGTEFDKVEGWDDKEKDDSLSEGKDLKKIESEKVIIRMNPRGEEIHTNIYDFSGVRKVEVDRVIDHKDLYRFDKTPRLDWYKYFHLGDHMGHESPPQVGRENSDEEKEKIELKIFFSGNNDSESGQATLALPEENGSSGERDLCEGGGPCDSTATTNGFEDLGIPGEKTTSRLPGGDGEDLRSETSSTVSSYQSSSAVSTSESHRNLFPNSVKTTTSSPLPRTTTIPSTSSSSTSPSSILPTVRRCCPLGHLFEKDGCIKKSTFLFVKGDVISQTLTRHEIRKVCCNASSILTHTTVQGDIDSVLFVRKGSKFLLKEEESLLEVPSEEYCLDGTDGANTFTTYYCVLPTILFHLTCGLNSRSTCARKCCPRGEVLKEDECVSLGEENAGTRLGKSLWQHVELVPIPGLPVCQKPLPEARQYTPQKDGELKVSNLSFAYQNYCVEYALDQTSNKLEQKVFACGENSPEVLVKDYFIIIGLLISCIFLSATLFFHAAIPEMRNLQGLTLMSYVASLLLADATLLTTKIYAQNIARAACIAIAFVMQLSFLASFFWLNVMCFDIWCYVGKTIQMVPMTTNMRDAEEDQLRYGRYALYAWGTPVIIVVITLSFTLVPPEVTTAITPTFRQGICWFHGDTVKLVFFYAPCGVLFFANLVLIMHTVIRLCQSGDTVRSLLTRTQSEPPSELQHYNRAHLKEFWYRFSFYSIMAMCWAAEVLSWWLGTPQEVWNITDILNTLQGLFVFVVFIANKQKRVLVSKFCDRKEVEFVIWWKSDNPLRSCFCRPGHSKKESIDRIQTTVNNIGKGIRSSMPACTPKMPTVPLSTVLSKTGKLVLSPDVLTKKRSSSLSNLTDSLKDATCTGKKATGDSITCQSMKRTFSLDFDLEVEGDSFYADS